MHRNTTALFLTAALLPGCAHKSDHDTATAGAKTAAPSATAAAQNNFFTGTLRGGAVAVGGETTGWRLIGDGQTGGIDLDVSKLRDRAKSLDGQRVTVTGRMTTRTWPERGPTQVLVIETIEPAAAPRGR